MSGVHCFNGLDEYLQQEHNEAIVNTDSKSHWTTVYKRINKYKWGIAINTISSVASCILLFSLCISCLVIYSDVSQTVVDAKGTLLDLNVILPEIHTTMIMLQHLCNTPEFKQYCFPGNISY